MPEPPLSLAPHPEEVPCPPPSRPHPDEQSLETFLHVWQHGRFAARIAWPRRRGAPVLAQDGAGKELALACAELARREEPPPAEELFSPVARALASERRLAVSDRGFALRFAPRLLGKLLRGQESGIVQQLRAWALTTLPDLAPRSEPYIFRVPLPLPNGKIPRVDVDVLVSVRDENQPAVSVTGSVPAPAEGPEALRRALREKLPLLAGAVADSRVLLVRSHAEREPGAIFASVRGFAEEYPLLQRLTQLVVAEGGSETVFWVREWNADARVSFDVWRPVFEKEAWAPAGAVTDEKLEQQARNFAAAAKAKNTLRAYQADWNDFGAWCAAHGCSALPAAPATVALYLTDRAATLKTSSLARRLTTISRAHQAAGHPSPAALQHAVVSEVWKGIQRSKGTAQLGKRPFLTVELRRVLEELPDSLGGRRDRALLLVGFAGGFRRSEFFQLYRTS